ncbi:MAG: SDR family NAD(P)-dependent oxidoreductase [Kineosporiaceae bacterium]
MSVLPLTDHEARDVMHEEHHRGQLRTPHGEQSRDEAASVDRPGDPHIAIIGLSGRFPGASDVDQFWENISNGLESFTTFSDEELRDAGVDPSEFADPAYVRSRPVLDDVRSFDASFFGMSPREAMLADPQQRLFTECVWEALESAGYGSPDTRGEVGVFAGTNFSTYLLTRAGGMQRAGADPDEMMAGNDKDSLATTVSYRLDLRGPSVAVQTFCSTSLVAVHLACAVLRRDECDLVVAGGVSVRQPDRVGYRYEEGNQASPDGHVRTFDDAARGSMFGDGVAVVVLKRLDRAVSDGDTILAVIRGSAVTNDGGQKFSYAAPGVDGQRRCVEAALVAAGVRPEEVSYVEAHGTATELGDPMEVAALTAAFGPGPPRGSVVLGSVKPNVGHLDRASGVTGLIKVVQSLRHGRLPGTRNFVTPNREIDFGGSPFRVTAESTDWPADPTRPRIAGVSSFGMGGTNCHVVLSEAPATPDRPQVPGRSQILPVSARWAEGADRACRALAGRLREEPDLELGDAAHTLQVGRKHFAHRRVVVADSTTEAVALLDSPTGPLARHDPAVGRRAAFIIAGVGEQYPGMVADLYADLPGFRTHVDEGTRMLGLSSVDQLCGLLTTADAPAASVDLAGLLGRRPPGDDTGATPGESPATARTIGDGALTQPAVFLVEYALARQLMSWGVEPATMIGYSLGEYVVACLAGVIDLEDALGLVAHRARLIAALPRGAMLAVNADATACDRLLGPLRDELDVAVRTGSQLVLAGDSDAIAAAATRLQEAAVAVRRLDTSHAYHSRMMLPAAAELTRWMRDNVRLESPRQPYLSTVTGRPAGEEVTDPAYWARHMCEAVDIDTALTHLLQDPGLAVLEVGPGHSLGALVRAHGACERERWPLVIPTLPGAADLRPAGRTLAEALGRLWLCGVGVDWKAVHGERRPRRVPLPTYPFQRREYWIEADPVGSGPLTGGAREPVDQAAMVSALPRLDEDQWLSRPTWRQVTARGPRPDAAHWLVLTDDGAGDEVAAALMTHLDAAPGARITVLRPGRVPATTPPGEGEPRHVRPASVPDLTAALRDLVRDGTHPPERIVHLWNLDARRPEEALDRGLYSLLAVAKAAGDLGLPPWSLDVVTLGSHRVHPGDEVRPDQVNSLGACRLIPVEYPGCRTRLVDIDAETLRSCLADLVAELRAEPDEQVVSLRAGTRWLPGYDVLPPDADKTPRTGFRPGGVYLITGGLGGIGLAMAERIAADYSAHLVLVGRTPLPAADHWTDILADPTTSAEVRRRVSGLQRMRESGARVVTVAGDVAIPGDLSRAVDIALAEFGCLDGILHCAGVPAMGLMQFRTATDVAAVLAPKVLGTRLLLDAVRPARPAFVVLFSSTTSSTGGGPGQIGYCAANAYLDACATSDPLPGTHVVAVDWGEWTWNGWTDGLNQYDEGSRQFFEQYRRDFGIDFDQGWRALQRALATGEHHVVVSTQDFPTIVRSSRLASIAQHQETVRRNRDAGGRHPRPDLSTAFIEPQTSLEEAISEIWAAALGLERVGSHDNFFELGGNSLVGMEIIAEVRSAAETPLLPPHLLYQAPTVALLAAAAEQARRSEDDPAHSTGVEAGVAAGDRDRIDRRRASLRTRRSA